MVRDTVLPLPSQVKTKWFIVADVGDGPRPVMTLGKKLSLFDNFRDIETLMKARGAIRWQAYVWVFQGLGDQ